MDLKDLTPKSDTFEVALVHPNTNEPLMNPDDNTYDYYHVGTSQ